MSTRSHIALQHEDGTIEAVYVHSDGYLDGVGQQLVDWIGGVPLERRKFVVDKLLAEKIGWSLINGKDIDAEPGWVDWDGRQDYDDYMKSEAYQRLQSYTARGETDFNPLVFKSVDEMFEACDEPYLYFISDNYSKLTVYGWGHKLIGEVDLVNYPRLKLDNGSTRAARLDSFIKEAN